MVENKNYSLEEMSTIISALDDLHLNLEPIRDKALDQKAFFTGYSQCAELMIKIIVTRADHLRNQLKEIENGSLHEAMNVDNNVDDAEVIPLVIDSKERKEKEETTIQED